MIDVENILKESIIFSTKTKNIIQTLKK
jgi:hypothetical protein